MSTKLINIDKYQTQEAFDKLKKHQAFCGSFMYTLIDAFFKACTDNRRKILLSFQEEFDAVINSKKQNGASLVHKEVVNQSE